MNRMHLKSKKSFLHKRYIIVLIMFLTVLYGFYRLVNNVFNILLVYAENEVIKLSSVIVNNAVDDDVLKELENYELFTVVKNNDNNIEMIDYNSLLVNRFLNKVTDNIQNELLDAETGDFSVINKQNGSDKILFNIPLGVIFDNPLFNNLGPKIPVRVEFVGSVLTNINTTIKEYGINNSLIEMVIQIELKEKIILPIVSKEILITNEVPISYKIMTGSVPNYYGEGISKNSNIYSLPLN